MEVHECLCRVVGYPQVVVNFNVVCLFYVTECTYGREGIIESKHLNVVHQ